MGKIKILHPKNIRSLTAMPPINTNKRNRKYTVFFFKSKKR